MINGNANQSGQLLRAPIRTDAFNAETAALALGNGCRSASLHSRPALTREALDAAPQKDAGGRAR
jgi:hypothetical protein